MSRIQVRRAADGFRWRLLAKTGDELHSSPGAFATLEAAAQSAFEYRQIVAVARVVDENGDRIDAPLIVPTL